jgi:invasion protein IalB
MMKQILHTYMSHIMAFGILILSSTAWGADFEFLGQEGDWDVFANAKSKASLCYIGSKPIKDEGDYSKRGDIYVLITLRKEEGFKDVVSFQQGYTLKSGSDVQVSVGSNNFKLFSSDETAWTYESKDDLALVKAMKAGSELVVKGVSSKGTQTTDTYSLKGISAAYEAMRKACS